LLAPESENIVICLDHVDASIEGVRVLKDVSLCVRAGEHLGIVGANGSGKSTLLALLSGERWPAPGGGKRRYRFSGRSYTDAVEAKQRITSIGPELQDRYVRLNWNFSAVAVVLTGLFHTEIPRQRASAAQRQHATELLTRVGAGDLADRSFLELSRGEQRRVLIARALAFAPEVLLLDEPASGLDTASRADLEETIRIASQHATIVTSAHSVKQLPAITQRCVRIAGGRVMAIPAQVAHQTNKAEQKIVSRVASNVAAETTVRGAAELPTPLIEIRHASIWIGERCVLTDIDWSLLPGQNWLVLGRNGAGKSTFLRLLHGQIRPARGGSIAWPGFGSPRNIWQLRRQIGWVSPELQANYLYPTTVFECIASGFKSSIGLTAPLSAAERARCEALLAGFELEGFADRPLRSLSYGQFRRALIARTLAASPQLLLLDEPWEGLDADTVELVCTELRNAIDEGLQIVCASHIGDAGLGLAHTLTIENGAMHVDGPAELR
jgi:molybdate transport system ATP-binding protein